VASPPGGFPPVRRCRYTPSSLATPSISCITEPSPGPERPGGSTGGGILFCSSTTVAW
jgi:hypothetical protein